MGHELTKEELYNIKKLIYFIIILVKHSNMNSSNTNNSG